MQRERGPINTANLNEPESTLRLLRGGFPYLPRLRHDVLQIWATHDVPPRFRFRLLGLLLARCRPSSHPRIREGNLLGVRDRGMAAMLRVLAVEGGVAPMGFE